MAFTTPGTAVAGDVLTASFWNLQVRDNFSDIQTRVIAARASQVNVVMGTDSTATTIASTTLTDTGLSVAITPSSATSKILLMAWIPGQSFLTGDENHGGCALLRNSTVLTTTDGRLQGHTGGTTGGFTALRTVQSIMYLDSPATTSAITYKIQGRVYTTAGSATYITQFGNQTSAIIAMEILV